ncbi:dUTP diphosphatase [Acidaminococcus provencensis]|uniref:dUTP diphosphatase n=1 Tax=Acidaminococcus provencensis TaxID=2058289 RepID=UPI000CF9AF80|nr:dUTP diphosphatase [Acidaminococcus provencensis]
MTEQVKIKLMPGGRMPKKKTAGAAAWDCYARIHEKYSPTDQLVLSAMDMGAKVPLGFAMELPKGYHAEILPRSSIGVKTKFRVSNSTGIIDSDYRGEVCIILDNISLVKRACIKDGDRIAQMLIVKDPDVELVQAEKLSETERGTGGFGSTGRRDRQEE